jgi:hypothetical protein
MPIFVQVVFVFLYLLAGCILSIPYTYLANGSFESFFLTAWIAPVAALFLFFVFKMRGILRQDGKRSWWGGGFFWAVVAYLCFPILLNGVSLLLKWAGHEVAGHYVFECRYFSLLSAPFCIAIADSIAGFRQWLGEWILR